MYDFLSMLLISKKIDHLWIPDSPANSVTISMISKISNILNNLKSFAWILCLLVNLFIYHFVRHHICIMYCI